ncbi:glycosyltransferase family 9 protein [Muriicola marianensis]|uniref:Heptosyltransferase n=1 Tax=Muriicola marianensis TaxID=1324801 RepID=A0ABQ1QWD7_9FLAO|nr:glycosyltransferase family 9 protein [Muriicola marianensis]GGD49712.1 heptosyltransferase [Muriicola marianensis]
MDKNKDDSLLVIRLSAMGDVAMTVPVLLSLLRLNPQLRLLILSRPFFVPIFRDLPNTEVFPADFKNNYKGLPGIFKLSKELKHKAISGIADLHNVLRTNILKTFFFGSGVRYVQIDKGRKEKKKLTRWHDKEITRLKSTHERYADVFRRMGYKVELNPQDILRPRTLSETSENWLSKGNKKLIGIAPFAAFEGKMYPLDLMEVVVKQINNTDQYKIILFGGGSKEILVLQRLEGKFEHCLSAAGQLAFDQELDLISNLDLMVSMDSGNGHLAAMFGIPTITLWGITHPYAGFAPYAQPMENSLVADRDQYPLIPTSVYGNKYPGGYEDVMRTIDPNTVVKRILEITSQIA